jgi:hypothetical protein
LNDNLKEICLILDSIKENLLEFERETINIISCDIDSIQNHTENRVSITSKMDESFKKIDEICSSMEKGSEIRKIIRNVSNYSSVEPENEPVFLKAQSIFSIVNRIKDSDIQAVDRINLEKNILLKKIKDINNGQEAKASKFKIGTSNDGSKLHFNNNSKSV